MKKIRILLVDDAAVVRRLGAQELNKDPDLEVVGTAGDGQIALSRLQELRPDVVVLDLEMPVLDGLQTLTALRQTHPRLPVIMFSRFTRRGVEATVHALTLGADDYVPKPGDGVDVATCIRDLLIPKIKLLARKNERRSRAMVVEPATLCPASDSRPLAAVEVIVIGASTGGPNALADLLPSFPADWDVPILIVQHMPPEFTTRLAERLTDKSLLRVREAAHGTPLNEAQVWIAPGDYHLVVGKSPRGHTLALNREAPVQSCRPSVDVLFASAAETFGRGVLAVVLTGMGQDGLRGCTAVRAAGGQVLVQDQESCVVGSMPGAVAQAGLAQAVLPLRHLGAEILRRVRPASRRSTP